MNNDDNQSRQFKTTKNINYFDFNYKDVDNVFIVIFDKHVFYQNIYVFVNKLKNLIKLSMIDAAERVRQLIFSCFRDEVFI